MCQISSLVATAESLKAEFSGFGNFEENKRKPNLIISFPNIDINQMESYGEKRKKIVISLLLADSNSIFLYLHYMCTT